MGKLPTKDLLKLLSCINNDSRVIISPQFGFDSGVHLLDEKKYLVVSSDPCIGVPKEWFGWLLINYVASDVALFGAKMEFCSINLLASLGTKPNVFQKVMEQVCNTAKNLGVNIVTGHTGTYGGLSTMVGVCTGYGYLIRNKLITPQDAKPGDYLLLIKPLGFETIINLSFCKQEFAQRLFGKKRVAELKGQVHFQSCVNEANLLCELDGVHAMHDTTEGGLLASLNEMAEASNVGFRINWDQIPFQKEVYVLRDFFNLTDIQLLSLSSTGSIIVAVDPDDFYKVESLFRKIGVEMSLLGVFSKDLKHVLVNNGKKTLFPSEPDDPYEHILSKKI